MDDRKYKPIFKYNHALDLNINNRDDEFTCLFLYFIIFFICSMFWIPVIIIVNVSSIGLLCRYFWRKHKEGELNKEIIKKLLTKIKSYVNISIKDKNL